MACRYNRHSCRAGASGDGWSREVCMKRKPIVASGALLAATVAFAAAPAPDSAWKWYRVITPASGGFSAPQCVVLDADLFVQAAPGLRDVRLVQDGREIAYAIDISFDEGAAKVNGPAARDRAQYEPALTIAALPAEWPGASASPRPDHPPGWFYGHGLLPAHVPVERVRIDPAPTGREWLSLRAAEESRPSQAEELNVALGQGVATAAFTIGANLQHSGDIRIGVHGESAVRSFVLEMRRRELCYQPLSTSPLKLLFGNPRALPVRYDYASHYQPSATPLLASMGPAMANPAYVAPQQRQLMTARSRQLLFAIALALAALVLTVVPLFTGLAGRKDVR